MSITPYYETELGKLYHGDCLEIMPMLEPVDLVLTDPPYGTTACKWDSIIPIEPMWKNLKRVIKNNGAIVMTASQPFTTTLISSNMKTFKYCWVWVKPKGTGHLNAKRMPMNDYEDVVVFYEKQCVYNPQMVAGEPYENKGGKTVKVNESGATTYGKFMTGGEYNKTNDGWRYPKRVISIPTVERGSVHPTQKPVALMEYLIKTYTNEGETVLDFSIGSGTTAIACERLNRRWIGIEIEEKYCEIAAKRIEKENQQLKLFN